MLNVVAYMSLIILLYRPIYLTRHELYLFLCYRTAGCKLQLYVQFNDSVLFMTSIFALTRNAFSHLAETKTYNVFICHTLPRL